MLQVQFIRENKETVLAGLAKRNFANAETLVAQVLTADENRRATQVAMDDVLAESNKFFTCSNSPPQHRLLAIGILFSI